jgi:hypothetical protein
MVGPCFWGRPHDDFHAGEGRVVLSAAFLAVHVSEGVAVALLKGISGLSKEVV